MGYPNFNEEKKLRKLGFKIIAGLDEAGRGPLAGPVVAAAVIFKIGNLKIDKSFENCKLEIENLVKDSKQLSQKQREYVYEKLIKYGGIEWGIGIVSEKVIDKINILEATKLAMQKALRQAQGKLNLDPDFLLLDGNFKIKTNILQKSIIKGDQKVFSISAASIIAKVTRDRLMQKYHKKYPQYGFDKHKGYGTKKHFENIKKFGPCKIHRKTFWPISSFK
jgi:ribonuclease HII